MSKYLVVIESPGKIQKIKKYLGDDYDVVASKGHVMDLPPKSLGVDVKSSFKPTYEAIVGKTQVIADIIKRAKAVDMVYFMTDPDREGSGIAATIARELPKSVKYLRATTTSITKDAVQGAIAKAGPIDLNLVSAFEARRVTDRLVGYQVSPVMWRKGISGASAGRVQSVALRYVVEREREIRGFEPDEYWEIDAITSMGFKARMWGVDGKAKTLTDEKTSSGVKKLMEAGPKVLKISSIEKKTRKRSAEPPFTTSTLQQAGNNVLGWGVDKTMQVAQKLFESGAITYHRTDSVHVEPEKVTALRDQIKTSSGKDYLPSKPNEYKSGKSSQEAHEAIRPTGDDAPALDADGQRLLDLITRRFIASQMKDAEFEQIKVDLEFVGTKVKINFRVNGSRQLFDGFLSVYGTATEDMVLPDLVVGQDVPYTKVGIAQKFTQPPPRYSDAALVKQMEKDGVGRPATYASIIKTLLTRKFVEKDKRSFSATELGEVVYDYLMKFFPDLVNPEFTAKMEESLDDVAEGKATYESALTAFYTPFAKTLTAAKKGDIKDLIRTTHLCPTCQTGYLLKRRGKDGDVFYACEGYPDCKTIATLEDGKAVAYEKPILEVSTEHKCPECAGPVVKRKGKYGEFFGCKNYPECKGIVKEGGEKKKGEPSGIKCQECGKDLLKRKGKFGEFLGCSGYPDCKTIMGIPLGKCPQDGGYVVEKYSKKKKQSFYACANYPKCEYATSNLKDFEALPTKPGFIETV